MPLDEPTPNLAAMTKDEILDWLRGYGVEVAKSWPKTRLVEVAQGQAVRNKVQHEADLRSALLRSVERWSTRTERDLPPPDPNLAYGQRPEFTQGWDYNPYRGHHKAYPAWSTIASHGEGEYVKTGRMSGSQNARHLYSTRAKALAALRRELSRELAEHLLVIDRELEKEADKGEVSDG